MSRLRKYTEYTPPEGRFEVKIIVEKPDSSQEVMLLQDDFVISSQESSFEKQINNTKELRQVVHNLQIMGLKEVRMKW